MGTSRWDQVERAAPQTPPRNSRVAAPSPLVCPSCPSPPSGPADAMPRTHEGPAPWLRTRPTMRQQAAATVVDIDPALGKATAKVNLKRAGQLCELVPVRPVGGPIGQGWARSIRWWWNYVERSVQRARLGGARRGQFLLPHQGFGTTAGGAAANWLQLPSVNAQVQGACNRQPAPRPWP